MEPPRKWEGFGAQEPATASTVILGRVYTSLLFKLIHHDHVQWVKGGSLKDEIRAEENRSTAAVKSTKAW